MAAAFSSLFGPIQRALKKKQKNDDEIMSSNAAAEKNSTHKKPINPKRPYPNKAFSKRDLKGMYERPRSFTDALPWLEYLPTSKCFLLEDGYSVAGGYEIWPVGTEGRSEAWLNSVRDKIEGVLQDVFDEDDVAPWVVQQYSFEDSNILDYCNQLIDYVWDHARDTPFTKEFLGVMTRHLKGTFKKEDGLFVDTQVMNGPWRGKITRTKLFIYRRRPKKWNHPAGLNPVEDLNDICDRLENQLSPIGVRFQRETGRDFYRWMLPWFSPDPPVAESDKNQLLQLMDYAGDNTGLYGDDFTENLFLSMPKTDLHSGTWWFDNLPHRCVRVQKMRHAPEAGHTTGERKQGDFVWSLTDKMPADTIQCITTIISPQDPVENHINAIGHHSIGETSEAEQTQRDCTTAKEYLAGKHKLYDASICYFLRGNDLKDLNRKTGQLYSLLVANKLLPVRETDELIPLDVYRMHLPMNFEPALAKKSYVSRLTFAQHIANLSPLFGRNRGTGNPLFTFFNRGGAPFSFDPLNENDRAKNGHMLILGPTGAGKSALCCYLVWCLLGIVRPRLVIIEAGNSFGLLIDYLEELEVSVNKVALKPGSGVTLPPFADAYKLFDQAAINAIDTQKIIEQGLEVGTSADDTLNPETLGQTTTKVTINAIFWAKWKLSLY